MTSSSAPLDAPEKKKSNPVLKWIFRIVMFFVILFVLAIIAMNVLNGTGSVQKSSIENIMGDAFKGKGFIKNLNQFSALPYVTLEMQDSVVLDKENETKLMMNADYFAFHTGLINIILKRPIFRRIEVKNFFAAPGTIAEKAIIIDYLMPVKDTNTLSVKGQYSQLPFAFTIEMEPLYTGGDLTYGFKLAKESKVEGTIGDLGVSFKLSNAHGGFFFDALTIKEKDKTLLTGSLKVSSGWKIIADLDINNAPLHANLNYDAAATDGKTRIKGELRIKSFDLSAIGTENDRFAALMDAVNTILGKINAPVDPIYSKKDAPEKNSALFAGLDIDIDVQLKNMQMQGAQLGDLSIPLKIENNVLKLDPITGQINGGQLGGALSLSENKAMEITYDHDLTLSQWDFGQFLTDREANNNDIKGKANFKSKIAATAPKFDALINNANGEFSFVIADSEMKSGVADKLMSGLVSAIMPTLEDSSITKVNCAIGQFNIKSGIANADTLFADMKRVQLVATGNVDLINQQYDLKLTPEAKRTALLDITPSVRIKGPLQEPKISPDVFSLGTKLGGALLGVVNPVFLAASLTDFGLGSSHSCSQFTEDKTGGNKKMDSKDEAKQQTPPTQTNENKE